MAETTATALHSRSSTKVSVNEWRRRRCIVRQNGGHIEQLLN